jgi:hypothetical protein
MNMLALPKRLSRAIADQVKLSPDDGLIYLEVPPF